MIMTAVVDASMWGVEVQGKTAICVGFNSAIIGVIGVGDTAKPEAFNALKVKY